MDISFELLSSMSPKVKKHNGKPASNKRPTKLTLKKYFRRSSLPNLNTSIKNNDSIIVIESSSSSTCSSSKNTKSENMPIMISKGESPFNTKKSSKYKNDTSTRSHKGSKNRLSQEKYADIKSWVNEVNNMKNTSVFSNLSSVYGDENNPYFKATSKEAASSTFLEPATSKRFDELFKKNCDRKSLSHSSLEDNDQSDVEIDDSMENKSDNKIKDSLITEDDSVPKIPEVINIEDSLDGLSLNDNQSIHSECENLLDGIYGASWREKREEILPSSEQCLRKVNRKVNKEPPKTERPVKVTNNFKKNVTENENNCSNNLLKTLQKARFKKALESPWMESLKKVCDPDSSSDEDNINHLLPTKLNFDDDQSNKNFTSSEKTSKVPTKPKKDDKITKSIKKTDTKISDNKNKSETGTLSFLTSLSATVPASKSNITALLYRNNFKEKREELTAKLFKLYNENIFNNAIPADTPLQWNDRMRHTAGYCYNRKITHRNGDIDRAARITLSTKVVDSADRLRDTLVHEMCHAATWIVNKVSDGHGQFWKSWADRAREIFPELPPVKRCHQYVINTKYTYKCINCGYSIGRHSKSLDIERKRCGYCYGKFEVFINKTSKSGETKSVPATPKKPSAFALFVKENYATHKTPDLTHGDVMKILGQKFSNLKVD